MECVHFSRPKKGKEGAYSMGGGWEEGTEMARSVRLETEEKTEKGVRRRGMDLHLRGR